MKTKEQIVSDLNKNFHMNLLNVSAIFTLEEFIEAIESGGISSYDGNGYFHDGEYETDKSVWNNSLTWDDVKDYPYVCWYNK